LPGLGLDTVGLVNITVPTSPAYDAPVRGVPVIILP